MPWQEWSPVEQRADFVREYQSGLFTMTELAAHYGISRKTGYKWVTVYEADGLAGLQDRAQASATRLGAPDDQAGSNACRPAPVPRRAATSGHA